MKKRRNSVKFLVLSVEAPNKAFKPLAKLARTPSTPHLVAHGFAIVAQTVLRTGRRLTGRFADASRPRNGAADTIRCLRGAKRRTTTRIKPTPGEKACGFLAFRGLSAAPLGINEKLSMRFLIALVMRSMLLPSSRSY